MLKFLDGKKTYAAAIGIVAVAVGTFLQGNADLAETVNAVLLGLGFAGLRAAK